MKCHRLPALVIVLTLAACSAVATDSTALPRYHWQLSDAVDSANHRIDSLFDPAEKPLQIDFSANALSVRNACNEIHGRYRLVMNHLVVDLLAQTMMACVQPARMQRETIIKQVLRGGRAIDMSRHAGHVRLTLGTPGGQSLTFTGVPVDGGR